MNLHRPAGHFNLDGGKLAVIRIVKSCVNHAIIGRVIDELRGEGFVGGAHVAGNRIPTGEEETVFGGIGRNGYRRAELGGNRLVDSAVHHEDRVVGVYGELSCDNDIVSGHGFGNEIPAREGVAFLGRVGRKIDRLTVFGQDRFVLDTVDHEHRVVGVDIEHRVDDDIVRGHSAGNVIPAREGAAFFGRVGGKRNGVAERNGGGVIDDFIDHKVSDVGILRECGVEGFVTGAHGSGLGIPAGEGIAFLGGVGRSADLSAELCRNGRVKLAVDIEVSVVGLC